MILDRIGFAVSDSARARAFYLAALTPLGIAVVEEGENWAMIGRDGEPRFWFAAVGTPPGRIHLAFSAADRAQIRAFQAVALAAGARDNGGPGLRPQYHPDYYGGFVIDPEGHNIEAVRHLPEP